MVMPLESSPLPRVQTLRPLYAAPENALQRSYALSRRGEKCPGTFSCTDTFSCTSRIKNWIIGNDVDTSHLDRAVISFLL